MANLVGVTFVFDEDFLLLKMPRSSSFQELRKAWAAEMKLHEDSHLFLCHSYDGSILPDIGSISQLLTSLHNMAFIIYVKQRDLSLREVARQQAERPVDLQPVADKSEQTFYVQIFPTDMLIGVHALVDLGESSCNDIVPPFRATNHDDTFLIACFLGSPYPLLTDLIEEHGANPHLVGLNGSSGLHHAARGGHLKTARLLIWQGVEIDARDVRLQTPLLIAASRGCFRMTRMLLDADADVEARDLGGMTPLMYAAWHGHARVVEWLLDYGADVDAVANNSWTPLMRACVEGHIECAQLLLKRNPVIGWCVCDKTALSLAAACGCLVVVQQLVESGVDMVSQRLRDALVSACDMGHDHVSAYLWPFFNALNLHDQQWSGKEELEGALHIYKGPDPFEGKRRVRPRRRRPEDDYVPRWEPPPAPPDTMPVMDRTTTTVVLVAPLLSGSEDSDEESPYA